ncbi:MAG: hypothetical protein ABI178_07335 [Rhodanobacter sp.]
MASVLTQRMPRDRIFYAAVPVVVAALVFAGFARSWFLRPFMEQAPGFPELTPLIAFHGMVFTGWISLNVLQPMLISSGRRNLHRRIGPWAAGLAALIVVLVPVITVQSMRHGGSPVFRQIHVFLAVNLISIFAFGLCVALAIIWRKRAETHKRLMLLALVPFLGPALGRIPAMEPLIPLGLIMGINLPIIAGIAFDLITRRRVHPVWIWGGSLMILSEFASFAIGTLPWWRAFGNWCMQLPI